MEGQARNQALHSWQTTTLTEDVQQKSVIDHVKGSLKIEENHIRDLTGL